MNKIAVIYWSGTGNTETMAKSIAKGIKEADLFYISDFDKAQIDQYDKIAFGCPSMGAEELEESEFEPFFKSIEDKLSSKKIALFGSYGWGDGEWMRNWEERVTNVGGILFNEGLIINGEPEDLTTCEEFGNLFSKM
ncbi:flavodoxin [Clostridium cellulovorans]|uniref:Flavodoxin n=1 Tax=Clostridium cellulovorans (strain ATCC 35296 / DSM 3052 / OCM 3 / 743B) TaxID=573061 RepID=D9SN06_CLOC7|nr:flavodoxin [Clostridium cellulovorans]ADL51872.1 flavodoxin [Clostridium cellulovorans 743B]